MPSMMFDKCQLLVAILLLQGEPAVGKYKVDVPAFERLALPQLNLKDQQLVVVDEVGT